MTFGPGSAGVYHYVCLLHPGMGGTVTVDDPNVALPHQQAFYDQQSAGQTLTILGQGLDLFVNGLATALRSGPNQVTAGIGALLPTKPTNFEGNVWVARFEPNVRVVHLGDTVNWTNLDPNTPHTITIGADPGPAGDAIPNGNTTITTAPGATNVTSGFVGSPLAFGPMVKPTYALTFDYACTYNYDCALHDDLGMKGTIVVLP